MAYYKNYKKPYQSKPVVKQSRVDCNWSNYQKAIFTDIASGTGNTQVNARAGSGKTSTIVEGFHHIPTGRKALMCAFNKSIQLELESRATEGVSVLTLHSLGFRTCKKAFPRMNSKPDLEKADGYIKAEVGGDNEKWELRDSLKKAISLSKGYLANTDEEIKSVMDKHDINVCDRTEKEFIELVKKIMTATGKDTHRVDFNDMVWLPTHYGISPEKHDFVFIDEAQDLNKAQIELALSAVNSNGRIISVGDVFQAIYGFAGADEHSINNIVSRCNSKELSLSVTYRCAKNIVELAKTIVPDLEAAPNAVNGIVEHVSISNLQRLARPGDFILSRVNAPLIKICLSFLKQGIPANIQGRDVGQNLLYIIKKSGANNVISFLSWLQDWKEQEYARLCALKRNTDLLEDKVDCLISLCENANNMNEVASNIDTMFYEKDDTNRIMLSSIHKAKGLERNRVFLLNKTCKPEASQEEKNIYYVGITRAKNSLFLTA
ncbi:MAG: UvrD-helicase domain-containing protein [Ferruginibacter sp.]